MSVLLNLPDRNDVLGLFSSLYGDDTEVKPCPPPAVSPSNKQLYALYVDDHNTPHAAMACDLPFAAFTASALTRIPVGGAEDAVQEGELSGMMQENFNEVMNIASTLIVSNFGDRVRLGSVHNDLAGAQQAGGDWLHDAGRTEAFSVDVPHYGKGTLTLMIRSSAP